jgi:S1-C subfamily serine protease
MSDSKKLPTTVGEIIAEEMNRLKFEETVTFNLSSLLRRHVTEQTAQPEKHKDEFSPFNTVNS